MELEKLLNILLYIGFVCGMVTTLHLVLVNL